MTYKPFPLQDEQDMQQWILRRLGAPLLKVELTADHLADNVEDAKRWFAAKKGWRRFHSMDVQPSINEYELPLDVDVVIDVVFSYNPLDLSILAYPYWMPTENNQIPYSVFNVGGSSGGLFSSYAQTLQYIETSRRVMSAEEDWRQEGRKLQLFPTPARGGKAIIEYSSHTMTPVFELSERDHEMLKRYALALAKKDLGRIRSKFDSYPTAQGTTQMDGGALLEEAKEEIEALNEELGNSAMPIGFLVG